MHNFDKKFCTLFSPQNLVVSLCAITYSYFYSTKDARFPPTVFFYLSFLLCHQPRAITLPTLCLRPCWGRLTGRRTAWLRWRMMRRGRRLGEAPGPRTTGAETGEPANSPPRLPVTPPLGCLRGLPDERMPRAVRDSPEPDGGWGGVQGPPTPILVSWWADPNPVLYVWGHRLWRQRDPCEPPWSVGGPSPLPPPGLGGPPQALPCRRLRAWQFLWVSMLLIRCGNSLFGTCVMPASAIATGWTSPWGSVVGIRCPRRFFFSCRFVPSICLLNK